MPGFSKDLIAATSIPLILSILSEGESYGYEIIKMIRERSGGKLAFAEGTLYPVLKKLEEKEFIKAEWKTTDSERQRKYYSVTRLGKKQLQAEKANWEFINNIFEKIWTTPTNLSLK